jgi:DNA-directed RNA polymerase subunit RPC12/RpoP
MIRDVNLTIMREPIGISTMSGCAPDPDWSETDPMGHVHRFEGKKLPTLKLVTARTYWCPDCHDEHEESEYRCRKCGHTIEPKWKSLGPRREIFPGPVSTILTINGVDVLLTDEERNLALSMTGDMKAMYVFAERIAEDRGLYFFP